MSFSHETRSGLLIAFEGADGSGKSTQAKLLADRLDDAVLTRQPGGTVFGQRVREIILDPGGAERSERAEALLFMADRAEQVDKLIEPALAAGRHVITDRSAYSSLAYQGYGRGLDVEDLRSISDWAMDGCWPDVVVLLDVSLDVSTARLSNRGQDLDHFEADGLDLQRKLIAGYHQLVDAEPQRWRVVDADEEQTEVAKRVWLAIEPFLDRC